MKSSTNDNDKAKHDCRFPCHQQQQQENQIRHQVLQCPCTELMRTLAERGALPQPFQSIWDELTKDDRNNLKALSGILWVLSSYHPELVVA